MYHAHRTIVCKPSLTGGIEQVGCSFAGVRAGYTIAQRISQTLTPRIDVDLGKIHPSIVPAPVPIRRTEPMGSVSSMASDGTAMPRWVPRAIIGFWLAFLGALAVRELFHMVSGFLLLLVVSLFLALAIEPGVNHLRARGWRRGVGTSTILFGVLIAGLIFVGVIGSLVGRQAADVLSDSQTYVNETVDFINDTFGANIDAAEVNDSIRDPNGPVQEFINRQQSRVFSLSLNVLGALLQVLSILLFTFYLVADGPRLRRVICSRLEPDRQRTVLDTWNLAIEKTGGYLYSRALLAVISSFIHWVAFQAIGTPAPIAMAVWVGIVSQFIPVLGTYLAGVLPLLLTFLDSPLKALLVLGFIVIYQQIENYLVAPRVTARTLNVHPAVAFGSAILGAAVLGPIGAILGLPAAAMIQALVSSWGVRHEVIDDALLREVEKKSRRSKKSR
jgi:predicted PurR-regulated permease PerM